MGVITLPANVETDRQNGIKASSVHVQGNFDALLDAVNRKLEIDGSIVPTADIPMGNHKLTGVATPTLTGDATNKGYVDTADTNLQNSINTLDAAVVKLAGSQTITGSKTFNAGTTFNSAITRSDALSAAETVAVQTVDTNGKGRTSQFSYYTGGTIYNRMFSENYTANKSMYLDVQTLDNGTGRVSIGGTATVDFTSPYSVMCNIAISKAGNGYCILSNGLIIQWGKVVGTPNTNYSVTFPIPFSGSNSYSLGTTPLVNGNTSNAFNAGASNLTSTGFNWYGQTSGARDTNSVFWIAIGY